jgi:hypothetical protein
MVEGVIIRRHGEKLCDIGNLAPQSSNKPMKLLNGKRAPTLFHE